MRVKMNYEYYDGDKSDPHNFYPVVVCTINGVKVSLLVDTGASASYLDRSFVDKHPELKNCVEKLESLVINTFNQDTDAIGLLTSTNFKFGRMRFVEAFFITHIHKHSTDKYDGMLGMTFFSAYNCVLNIPEKIIEINTVDS